MHEYEFPCCGLDFWLFLTICLVIVLLAGITSGLALGILSYSQVDLEVLIKGGRPKEKRNAERIQPFVKNGHFVLCTLLLGKSLAMEVYMHITLFFFGTKPTFLFLNNEMKSLF